MWFGGTNNYVFIAGYIPDGETVSIVRMSNVRGGPDETVIDLTELGQPRGELTLDANRSGEIRVIIDLHEDTPEGDPRVFNLESLEFDRVLESCTLDSCNTQLAGR